MLRVSEIGKSAEGTGASRARFGTLMLAALLVILLAEAFVFNFPHWNSLGKPAPDGEISAFDVEGMSALQDGTKRVEDTSRAYLDAPVSNQTVEYIRLVPSQTRTYTHTVSGNTHVRIDVKPSDGGDWVTGRADTFSYRSSPSTYLKNRTGYSGRVSAVRVWFQEPAGTRIPVEGVVVNARVPFRFDVARVAILSALAAVVLALRPRSRLHRVALDTRSAGQRLAFWLVLGVPCAGAFAWALYGNGLVQWPASFHNSNSYVYDFNQFQQTADAILHGRAWLDLFVNPQLAEASNPYDAGVREELLSRGTFPIYWDHVLYEGRYYSYFGVVPVLLFFLPFQAVTSLWTPGGLSLSTSTAGAFMLAVAVVFGGLCTVRFVQRHMPSASVATVVLAFILLFSGSTVMAPICRVDFYTIPFCAGLFCASIGLYLWQGALRVADPALGVSRRGRARTRVWTVEDGECDPATVRVSLPRLFFGSLFMAATLGCRPPFIALTVMLVPMIVAICRQMSRRKGDGGRRIAAAVAVCAVPVAVVFAGLGYWNQVRFGSPLDFGNDYQLTVVDLQSYREPLDVLAEIVAYYLFQPIEPVARFPFITAPQISLSSWQCYEPIIGGMFFMTPLLLLGLAFPFLKDRLVRMQGWLACWLDAAVGVLMLVFISYKGGLLWRYKIDFALYMCVVSMYVLLILMDVVDSHLDSRGGRAACWGVLLLTVAAGVLCIQCAFVDNVSYPLVNDQPGIYHDFRSWFQLLL